MAENNLEQRGNQARFHLGSHGYIDIYHEGNFLLVRSLDTQLAIFPLTGNQFEIVPQERPGVVKILNED